MHTPQLISGIYDTFLNTSEKKNAGTYYTPHTLADFVIEETMPIELVESNMKVLDPSCGSGVFLVRAFQRLVTAWIREHDGIRPNLNQLHEIVEQNIFGVDISLAAIQIAEFSLYLAIIDSLDEKILLTEQISFPALLDKNLLVGDFFAKNIQEKLQKHRFDRIIGNPPWKSGLTKHAEYWLKENNLEVRDKQIAQAFLLATPQMTSPGGEIAMLAPAKSTIHVTSGTHDTFRKYFFENYSVRALFNLSALCYELFDDAIHPTVVIFYKSDTPNKNEKFVYVTPKPTSNFRQMGSIVIEAIDVKYLSPSQVLDKPSLWKIALWGTPSDENLITKLQQFNTLAEHVENYGFHMAEGIQVGGGDKNKGDWLIGMPIVPTSKVQRYALDTSDFDTITEKNFHRPRTRDLVQAPLALIRQSPANGYCSAAFHDKDIAFRHKITAISGHADKAYVLKWIVAFINSPIAQYYHFMTSTSWAIERGTIINYEYEKMPLPIPNSENPSFQKLLRLFDDITDVISGSSNLDRRVQKLKIHELEKDIFDLVYEIVGLFEHERKLIQDTVDYTIDFFYWGKQKTRKPGGSIAVERPGFNILEAYATTFGKTVNALLQYQGSTLRPVIYTNGTPLNIVGFEKIPLDIEADLTPTLVETTAEIRNVMRKLDNALLEQKTPSLFIRRQVRIFDGNWIYIVRPAENRFWTESRAVIDANEAIRDGINQSSAKQLVGEISG